MLSTFKYPQFSYQRAQDWDDASLRHHPVIVVGGGPVGLSAALDLARQGQAVVLLDNDDTVSIGSRGVCYAKRALEVLDRMGAGDPIVDLGVSWNVGRTFFREQEVYHFNLSPQSDHERPGMINLQQYHLEDQLVKAAQQTPLLDLRWKNNVVGVRQENKRAFVTVETPDGTYELSTDWLVVADGARSPVRHLLGLSMQGQMFKDRFLIADVVMKAGFPPERWFWFDPPFHRNQSVLLHRQADNVWRIDFQLGWDVDPEFEQRPENVIPRVRAMLGNDAEFELEWVSIYTFQCRRMEKLRHDRILFVGDAAHQVSPFGARGANSGIQDADNLMWKLKWVIDGHADERLLDSYHLERSFAADENLMNSTRSTDFITPKSPTSLGFRNAVLDLAREHPFARALVNSGRLSVPSFLTNSPLNTADQDTFSGKMVPGAPADDAPVAYQGQAQWLMRLFTTQFHVLVACEHPDQLPQAVQAELQTLQKQVTQPLKIWLVSRQAGHANAWPVLHDTKGRVFERYNLTDGAVYLIRPDQHVCARWRQLNAALVLAALQRACAQDAAAFQPDPSPAPVATPLILTPNFNEPGVRHFRDFSAGDDFYEALIDMHRDLSDADSAAVNTRLILLLANHIGDNSVLRQAMQRARSAAPQDAISPPPTPAA